MNPKTLFKKIMTMIGQVIKIFFLYLIPIIWISLRICSYTIDDIPKNSMYYAQHIPHKEGIYPQIMMLTNNIELIGVISYSYFYPFEKHDDEYTNDLPIVNYLMEDVPSPFADGVIVLAGNGLDPGIDTRLYRIKNNEMDHFFFRNDNNTHYSISIRTGITTRINEEKPDHPNDPMSKQWDRWVWDRGGRLISVPPQYLTREHPYPQEKDREIAKKHFDELTKNIYQNQKTPSPNYQWLFNLYYYDQFSRGAK